MPLVLLVNPQLWERPRFRYDPFSQWLANRGYAVFTPVTRGVTGFGKRFELAGFRDFGGVLLADHLDAARWLIKQGYTDRDRLAIVGYGLGGSMATLAFGKHADLFAAGVNLLGPLDLNRLLVTTPRQSPQYDYLTERIGDHTTERHRIASASPVAHLLGVERPYFVVRRLNDAGISSLDVDLLEAFSNFQNVPITDVVAFANPLDGSIDPQVSHKFDNLLASFLAFVLGGRSDLIWESDYGKDVVVRLDAGYLLWEQPDVDTAMEEDQPPLDLPDTSD